MIQYLIFCLFIISSDAVGRTQSTAVEGVLLCEDKPATGVLVKLYEHDSVSLDDLIDSAETDSDGHFKLQGHADKVSSIDPKINIYHDCDDSIKPCQRRLTIYVPDNYVTKAKQPSRVFNLGRIQLAGKYEGEARDCIH